MIRRSPRKRSEGTRSVRDLLYPITPTIDALQLGLPATISPDLPTFGAA